MFIFLDGIQGFRVGGQGDLVHHGQRGRQAQEKAHDQVRGEPEPTARVVFTRCLCFPPRLIVIPNVGSCRGHETFGARYVCFFYNTTAAPGSRKGSSNSLIKQSNQKKLPVDF